MRKRNELISALTPISPVRIIDTRTGEYVSLSILQDKITQVVTTVHDETMRLYDEHRTNLFESLTDYSGTPQAAEFARQKGISSSFRDTLPREILVKSRLEKLVQFKVISETAAYVNNPNPDKKEPSFGWTINLGAVDKHMASLSYEDAEINMLWKCWDAEYYLTFRVPQYVQKRDIVKFSLPVVKRNRKTKQYEFIFSLFEKMKPRKGNKHVVGIDLGKVIPYSMVVINESTQRVASYETSPRLTKLSQKRERLLTESYRIHSKIENRTKRGLSSPVQQIELERITGKTNRLTVTVVQQTGSEIASKLAKHNSSLIKVENLSWVSGTTSSKIGSSRWSQSAQQDAITHATSRIGYKTKKVSASGTSQTCHKCGECITHRKNRTVWCASCKTVLDRDFNAAMNIAKQPILPVSKKLNGGTTGNSGVVHLDKEALLGKLVTNLSVMTRKTT